MKIAILLHSTTGNTKVVTKYGAAWLRAQGHECSVINIVKERTPPDLDGVDLLGVSCPSMYFRATFAMERYVARIPNAPLSGRPAFLLATCAGEPGAHFALQAEQLAFKGYTVLGGHWVLAPANVMPWAIKGTQAMAALNQAMANGSPQLQRAYQALRPGLRTLLCTGSLRPLRLIWGSAGSDLGCPDAQDRDRLEAFLRRMAEHAASWSPGAPTPSPNELHRGVPLSITIGRAFPMEIIDQMTLLHVKKSRCTDCGTCLKICPVGVITRPGEGELPVVGKGCTGCLACFNRCPEGAIGASFLEAGPKGIGQYRRPPELMREVFDIHGIGSAPPRTT